MGRTITGIAISPLPSDLSNLSIGPFILLQPGRRPILFYKTPKAPSHSEPLTVKEKGESSSASFVVRDPRLVCLLRKAGVEVKDNGMLPPTPWLFERLRSPTELDEEMALGGPREARGLGYVDPFSKSRVSHCNHTALLLGDSSESDDEELLLLQPDDMIPLRKRFQSSHSLPPWK